MGDVVVCDAARFFLGNSFVVVFRVFGNDVPGVEQAGEVAEDAEEDVDQRVGAAQACLDPDWETLA